MTRPVAFRDLAVGAVYLSVTNDDYPNAAGYRRVKVSKWRWRFAGDSFTAPTYTAELGDPVIAVGIADTSGGVE